MYDLSCISDVRGLICSVFFKGHSMQNSVLPFSVLKEIKLSTFCTVYSSLGGCDFFIYFLVTRTLKSLALECFVNRNVYFKKNQVEKNGNSICIFQLKLAEIFVFNTKFSLLP